MPEHTTCDDNCTTDNCPFQAAALEAAMKRHPSGRARTQTGAAEWFPRGYRTVASMLN